MPPMKCEQCGKEFKSEQGLKIHVGRQHGNKPKVKRGRRKTTPTGGVTCDVCGRTFRLPLHLGRHVSVAHGTGGKKKTARRLRRRGRRRMPAGLDVSGLTVDQLLSLKSAVDGRLAQIVQKLRKAKVGI
jgi:uncharacterized C2H2 Zn-finger protein